MKLDAAKLLEELSIASADLRKMAREQKDAMESAVPKECAQPSAKDTTNDQR
jgi:hypothetical protein